MRSWVLRKSFICLNLATNNTKTYIGVFGLSSSRRIRHLDWIKDIKRHYVYQMFLRQHTTPNQKTGMTVLAHVIKKKNSLYNYHSLKWNYKSNPVYSSLFMRWEKKNEECLHFSVQDKLVVFPHWYSKELFFPLRQLASFELKIRIFNFYQCTTSSLTFLDISGNITMKLAEKSVIKQQLY